MNSVIASKGTVKPIWLPKIADANNQSKYLTTFLLRRELQIAVLELFRIT